MHELFHKTEERVVGEANPSCAFPGVPQMLPHGPPVRMRRRLIFSQHRKRSEIVHELTLFGLSYLGKDFRVVKQKWTFLPMLTNSSLLVCLFWLPMAARMTDCDLVFPSGWTSLIESGDLRDWWSQNSSTLGSLVRADENTISSSIPLSLL
ncbi:hypothetical protein F4808DRAFT_27142 [Astrocystis sublimbata]|nr:hypothetical protein F4808DRAFT_27142 [Astrocystis sublimbata]